MKYSEEILNELRQTIGARISEKRFSHTLAVEQCALLIGNIIGYSSPDLLSAAAIAHDIAKELPTDAQIEILTKYGFDIFPEDIASPEILHSFCGAFVFRELGERYYSPEVARAIADHTVGSEDMSVLSMIIFISDYIEHTRKYPVCIAMRAEALDLLKMAEWNFEKILAAICLKIIRLTEKHLIKSGKPVNSRMKKTENSLLKKYFQN